MSNQQRVILAHLYRGEEHTNKTAMNELDIGKLSTRVSELRADGWDIPDKSVPNETNTGHHSVYCMSENDKIRYANEVLHD